MGTLRNLFSVFIIALSVYAEGPFCTQSGIGPADMMMENGNMNPKYMWEKSGGSVGIPVVLDHGYSHREREVVFGGLAELASKTCIKFLVYNHPEEVHDGDYVYITKSKGKGCWSYVGKQGGHQDLSLPAGCINHRTVMHEMMHALGFSHEHVRADRDKYVHIQWDNIQRGRERNFEKKHDSKSDAFGPYDYDSIMHYDNRAFSRNGRDTIRPTRHAQIGRGKRMSHWDAEKINRAYKCHGRSGKSRPGFGGFGFNPSENGNALDAPRFVFDNNHSFRLANPFFGGVGESFRPHPNEVDHEEEEPDYHNHPFGSAPFFPPNGERDDYYDH